MGHFPSRALFSNVTAVIHEVIQPVGEGVGKVVGFREGKGVGKKVGIGEEVGTGEKVGKLVGICEGALVGKLVGICEGAFVGGSRLQMALLLGQPPSEHFLGRQFLVQ